MPKTTTYLLGNNAASFTSIPLTIWARRVEVREDEAAPGPQGLIFQKPELDGTFSKPEQCGPPASPNTPQIVLGNVIAHGAGRGQMLGNPAQNQASGGSSGASATTILKVKSATAQATTIQVTEYE